MDQSRSFDQISGDTSSAVPVIDDDDRRPPVPFPDRNDDYHNTRFFPATTYGYNNEEALRSRGDDRCSCVAVIVTFGLFASMALVLGVYGPSNLQLGPNSSILLKPNPIFVENIKVEEMDDGSNGPTVYGFYENPSLDVLTTFYEAYKTSLPANHHKEWIYYLNQGSQINISYSVNSKNSDSLVLIIAQGSEGLAQWLENPLYPSTEFSWNAIHGNGTVSLEIGKSSTYYVAVGNLKPGIVQVRLDIKGIALLYNTAGAYYECNLGRKQCSTRFPFPHGGAVLLTSPPQRPGTASGTWNIKISYGPQWSIYVLGLGALSFLIFGVFWYLKNKQSNRPVGRDPSGPIQQTPLLSGKDDDLASCGSSFDGLSQDDEYNEDGLDPTAPQGRQVKDGEYNSNARQLCTICFDAPRDCFFLPCGHCASCFNCGTRIAEAAGTCPICRRPMKKVRKIYTV